MKRNQERKELPEYQKELKNHYFSEKSKIRKWTRRGRLKDEKNLTIHI